MRVIYILTASQSAGFLEGQLRYLRDAGMRIDICAPERTDLINSLRHEAGGDLYTCAIKRQIHPFEDFVSLIRLLHVIHKSRPDVAITVGPKAGLLGSMASWIMGVAAIVQMKWGLRYETLRGSLRFVAMAAEKLAAAFSTKLFFDGESTLFTAVKDGVVPAHKALLIANGSANGIDTSLFSRKPENIRSANAFARDLGIEPGAHVVGFIGRLCMDKGLRELCEAWGKITETLPTAHLVVCGKDECRSAEERRWRDKLLAMHNVHYAGYREGVPSFICGFSVLLLPSHREGFGVAVLEAASCGIPTVAFDVTGMRDSVVHGVTGMLCPLGDSATLAQNVLLYLTNESVRLAHGEHGRLRAQSMFNQELVWESYKREILRLNDA